ncbi:dTDP-4-dehydrorhamnose reductase [Hyphomicrobium sp. 99]|uniref:dTDP-4-dehydrorhamnose reductase n=1 Tax=Hyphomicrobium sp. 99 TaxID=1163419 RepID=UPI0012E0A67A|nr:dTDP-4-dehydrorhamnose reductase [Hyphomicrobium sp. 99]
MTDVPCSTFIIGKSGQVSSSLLEALRAEDNRVFACGRPEIDLLDPESVRRAILAARPKVVVNAAAYTAVDRAEDEPEIAYAVNAAGAEAAAKAAAEIDAAIIHFSTDYVFDGSKRTPYVETDPVSPIGVYGRSKQEGEVRVAAANPKHIILRTAWIFSPFGGNFAKTMLRLSKERREIKVVDDQCGNPTHALDLAELVRKVLPLASAQSPDPRIFGTFHTVNHGETTWFGFAKAILEGAAQRGGSEVAVLPIGTKDYPTKAERPAYSVLSTDKLRDVTGFQLRPWREALSDCLDRLAGSPHRVAAERSQQIGGKFA